MKKPSNSQVYILSWILMGSTNSCLRSDKNRHFKFFRLNPLVAGFDGLTRARWYFVNQTVGYLANCVVLRVAQVMQNHREKRWSSFCWDTRYYYCTTRPTPRATEARRALSRLLSGSAVNIISGGPNTQSHW